MNRDPKSHDVLSLRPDDQSGGWEGNTLSEVEQWAKVRSVVAIADRVWR